MIAAWIRELSAMLGWDAYAVVAMIEYYFDESYQVDQPTGHAVRLTMGGCIAPAERWRQFSEKWKTAINQFGLDMFHMADFEADKQDFAGWKNDRPNDRVVLLNRLLDLMAEYVEGYVGTFIEVKAYGEKQKDHYQDLVINSLKSASVSASKQSGSADRMPVVFAQHQNLSPAKADAFSAVLMKIKDAPIGPVTAARPLDVMPLQAADIFAYELSRHLRFSSHQRYPLKRILEDAAKRGIKVTTHLYTESFRSDPRASGVILPGTMLPPPSGKV